MLTLVLSSLRSRLTPSELIDESKKNAPFSRGREVRIRVSRIQLKISPLSTRTVMTSHDSTGSVEWRGRSKRAIRTPRSATATLGRFHLPTLGTVSALVGGTDAIRFSAWSPRFRLRCAEACVAWFRVLGGAVWSSDRCSEQPTGRELLDSRC